MDIEQTLYRIINGYYTINIDNTIYKVVLPNIDIKQKAHQLYLAVLEDHKYDSSWISQSVINNLLVTYNIWNDDYEKELKQNLENINKLKIDLYLNYINSKIKSKIKNTLEQTNLLVNNLYNKKYYFDYLTLEYYAQNIKNQYLITNMVYDSNNNKVFESDNLENINANFLEKILLEIHKNTVDTTTIKKIARYELWKSFWTISKEKIFAGSAKDWTDEQRSLLNFSRVLDSIREHMEAPAEIIMEDDDALDGWILYQNDKNEKEKKRKQISDRYNLDKKNAGEVFLIANDQEDIENIYSLNDKQTNQDIQQMMKLAQEKGQIDWADLPHIQRDLRQQLSQSAK